jgi:hypothetical protein
MARQCIVCSADIPEGRIKILPNTKTCVNHSTTEAYAARRTFNGSSADDLDTGIEIFRNPDEARRLDELDNQRYK